MSRSPFSCEIMFFPLIALFLGLAHAQHRCCGPSQWEAYFGQLEGFYDEKSHHAGLISGLDIVHFDYPNKRMVTKTNLLVEGHPYNGTIYNDYNRMKQFVYSGTNCTVTSITVPMFSNCVPANSTFIGSTYFGTGSSKLMLDAWMVAFDTFKLTLTMTQNGCYPVTEGIVGDFGNGGTLSQCKDKGSCVEAMIAFGITGMTTGIQDVSIFNIPEKCTNTLESHEPIEAHSISHMMHEVKRRYS